MLIAELHENYNTKHIKQIIYTYKILRTKYFKKSGQMEHRQCNQEGIYRS